ncbi:ABC transporter substrate-binding protein [Streptomyces sp. NBC_00459]|uniref:ABC transporter substrate-binding protein n=1 Tax=Streptomyces sp. NBC_00459 TaxID=2975749 RepID=UPI002E18ED0E
MKRHPRTTVLVAGCCALLTLSACGGSGGKNTADTGKTKVQAQLAAATGDIDKLTWALPKGEPTTIDPVNAVDYSSALVASNLCDTLLRYNPDFTTSPGLATAVQKDDRTVVLTVRDGATFWDGTPVTAEDVAFSLNRGMAPTAVVGFVFANVSSITAAGSSMVTVKFKEPDELFLKELSTVAGLVVQESYTKKAGKSFGTASGGIMCSGPLKLDSWKPGSEIRLTRNDDYWDKEYRSHAAEVILSFVTDSAALVQGLKSGEIDGAYEVPASVIPSLQNGSAGSVYFGQSPQSLEFAVATADGPLKNTDLRRALMIAIDREALAEAVYHGAAEPNYTLLASSTWDPDGRELWKKASDRYTTENAYDLDKAKELVKSSGYTGQKLTLSVQAGDDTFSRIAQLIQQQAEQIGVKIAINQAQPLEYSTMLYDSEARKGTDLLLSANFNGAPDPLEYLGFVFTPGGPYNWAGYEDQKVFDAVAEARQTFDTAERVKLLTDSQSAWEKAATGTSLVNTYEVSYLGKDLTGATTSFPYLFTPSLALIGRK